MGQVLNGGHIRSLCVLLVTSVVAGCGGGGPSSPDDARASATPDMQILSAPSIRAGCARNPTGLTPIFKDDQTTSGGQHLLGNKVVPAQPQTECDRDISLTGQDANNNFVRDDVERAIAAKYGRSANQVPYNAAMRYAFYLQTGWKTLNSGNPIGPAVQATLLNLWACWAVDGLVPTTASNLENIKIVEALRDVRNWMGDTKSVPELGFSGRSDAYLALEAAVDAYSKNRAFDVDTLYQGCRLARVALPVAVAQNGRTNVLYINGVLNDFKNALAGALALRGAIETPPQNRMKRASGVRVFFFHNPTDWWLGAGDADEIRQSKISEENYINEYRKNFRPDVLDPQKSAPQAKKMLAHLANESYRIQDAVKSVSDYFLPGLKAGGKLVVVAHSEGNVIAQWFHLRAMAELNGSQFSRMRVVNVANIMRTSPNGLDISSPRDYVLNSLLNGLGLLRPRVTSECPTIGAVFGNCPFAHRSATVIGSLGICPASIGIASHLFSEEYLGTTNSASDLQNPACLYRPTQELAANASIAAPPGTPTDGVRIFTLFKPLRDLVIDTVYTALDAVEFDTPVGFKILPNGYTEWLASPDVSVSVTGEISIPPRSSQRRQQVLSRAAYPGTDIRMSWSGCLGITHLSYQWAGLNYNGRDGMLTGVGSQPVMGFLTRWESPGQLQFHVFGGDYDDAPLPSTNPVSTNIIDGAAAGNHICGDFILGVASSSNDGKRRGYASFRPAPPSAVPAFERVGIDIPPGVLRAEFNVYEAPTTIKGLTLESACATTTFGAASCFMNTPRDRN